MHKVKSFGAEIDADQGQVEAVVCTYGVVDRDGDVVQKGAIKEDTPVIISDYNHSTIRGTTLPVGKGFIRTIGNEAVLKAQYFMDTAAGRDAFAVVKSLHEDGIGEWSWGFLATDTEQSEVDGKNVTLIKDTSTFEASFVALGAGVNTRTLSAKGKKFSDEGDEVLTSLKSYVSRASDVVAMRREKGKSIGDESRELIEEMISELKSLEDLLTEPASEEDDEPDYSAEAQKAALTFLAIENDIT